MEKVCRKSILKTSPITLLNFVKYPKNSRCMQMTFKKFKRHQREDILKEKKLTSFFPLHTVPYLWTRL